MSNHWAAAPVDNTTLMDSAGIDAHPAALDEILGKHAGSYAFAVCRTPLTQNGTTVKWREIDVFHYAASTADVGKLIRQRINADTTGVAVPNNNALVVTISDTDGATLSGPTAVDIDALPTSLRDKNKVVLVARPTMGSGTGLLHYVALRAPLNLRGSGNLASGTTTTTVNLPTGYTMPTNEYNVFLQGTAAGYYPRDPVVTTKATTSFTITHTNTGGTEAFDWMLIPN